MALQKGGIIIPYQAVIPRASHPQGGRYLWLTPDVLKWCQPADAHPDQRINDEALSNLADQMNAFVWGEFMDHQDDVKRLDPHNKDIWEIRSYLKKPQLRVFGWFVLPKWFVAVHHEVRDDLEPVSGPKWDAAISKSEHFRDSHVGHVEFFNDEPREYIKNPT